MNRTKKILCIFIAVILSIVIVPMSVAAEEGEETVKLSDFTEYYGRQALEKLPNAPALLYAYDSISACVEASRESASLYNGESYISVSELTVVIDAYMRDYAHHFWLSKRYSYSYIDESKVTKYVPQYTMAGSTLELAKAEFSAAADEILANINDSMTDYEKELILHDELVKRVVYDLEAPHAHDAYGALVEGRAVCEGYAESFQYLLHRAGIKSFLVIGSSRGVGHEWNTVCIDGEYYHVDPTWNDQGDTIYHAYFNTSEEVIKEDHAIDPTVYQLPECNTMDAHYFTVNGNIYEVGGCTTDEIAALIKKNIPQTHVYVNGDVTAFLQWYYDNITDIAVKVGVVGSFSYGYAALGREVVLVLDGEVPEPEYVPGDINGDGMITNADVLEIYRYIYNPELYPINNKAGDVNKDGYITNADVLEIYRYIYNPELYPIG